MKRLLFIIAVASMPAQEHEDFQSPHAYPTTRYEAIWNKNPFTLKTAPSAVNDGAFAKDLAIASIYGDKANPTVVVVNTKTHQRFNLQKGRMSDEGLILGEIDLGRSRSSMTAELWKGGERAMLHYDASYVRGLASSASPSVVQPSGAKGSSSPVPATIPLPKIPQTGGQRAVVPPSVPKPASSNLSDAGTPAVSRQRMPGLPTFRPSAANR